MNAGSPDLPKATLRFLETLGGQRIEPVVRRFHRWLWHKDLLVSAIGPQDVEDFFDKPFRSLISPRTAYAYKRALIHYLAWLYQRGELDFDPKDLGVRRRRPLPPLAEAFLRTLEPTLRPSTCRHYRTSLQCFHEWLDDARLRLRPVKRPQMEQWLLALGDQGLHAATRIHAIQNVRSYLRWLEERGELRRAADTLLRGSDMPKLPTYLPRPLPPDIDRALQERLALAPHPLWQGLLLMRHTGLRIGELRTLEYDCVRTDPDENFFLKVPLGKLNSERLVPLSPQAAQVLRRLQQAGKPKRRYLLEASDENPVPYAKLSEALGRACEGLETPEPITSHRLRHTYATSLLNAGMSLVAIMKLLGHRDYRMTLRYTAITQETVGKEYLEALAHLEERYAALRSTDQNNALDPVKALSDVLAWAHNRLGHEPDTAPLARTLAKRLIRLRDAITPHAQPPRKK